LPNTRHAPHRESPEATLRATSQFVNRLLREHHEGDMSARDRAVAISAEKSGRNRRRETSAR
jgi:hypothetical protein